MPESAQQEKEKAKAKAEADKLRREKARQEFVKRQQEQPQKQRRGSMRANAPAPAPEPEPEPESAPRGPTSPEHCSLSGDGLHKATVRQEASFTIVSCNAEGRARKEGGDTFFVAVRGGSQVRARVKDNGDGTYEAVYKPSVSGKYSIAVSLFGVSLPGSPFEIDVISPHPAAEQCELSGDALHTIIKFRDQLGHTTTAEELDVFIERRSQDDHDAAVVDVTDAVAAAGSDGGGKASATSPAPAPAPESPVPEAPESPVAASSGGAGGGGGSASDIEGHGDGHGADGSGGEGGGSGQGGGEMPSPTTKRTARGGGGSSFVRQRVEVGKKPLVVRSGFEVHSQHVGQLGPGTLVFVLEERLTSDGDLRARVALEHAEGDEKVEDGWWKEKLEEKLKLLQLQPDTATGSPTTSPLRRSSGSLKGVKWEHGPSGDLLGSGDGVASPTRRHGKGLKSGRSSSRKEKDKAQTPRVRNRGKKGAGWVTLVKGDQCLVRKREKLDAGQRQLHMQQWARRLAADKTFATATGSFGKKKSKGDRDADRNKSKKGAALVVADGRKEQNVFAMERMAGEAGSHDRSGFAFGGTYPGVLYARGQLHETHKCTYSVGRAGQYLLHVRLRNQALSLPGSPFELLVKPDKPHAQSTTLPADSQPLSGVVGHKESDGCHVRLLTADKMGNTCDAGGATVVVKCSDDRVEATCTDNGDGSYSLAWRSKFCGTSEVGILIGDAHIVGSPASMRLTSTHPDLSKTELKGDGLDTANAGKATVFDVFFVDQYENPSTPSAALQLGMALVTEHAAKRNEGPNPTTCTSHGFESEWIEEGQLRVTYIATGAGGNELHVWCDQTDQDQISLDSGRVPLPGSPFSLSVYSGPGNLNTSELPADGLTRDAEAAEKPGGKFNVRNLPEYAEDVTMIITGDVVLIRPKILDEFGNPAKLPDDALTVHHQLPDGTREPVDFSPVTIGGLTTYDIRDTPHVAGVHEAHVLLYSKPIPGSPLCYTVLPDYHEASMSVLEPPELPEDSEHLHTEEEYTIRVVLRDRFGNRCDRGGAIISARMNYIKQGVHDSTALTMNNHTVEVEDFGDGSYAVKVMLGLGSSERALFPATVNVEVNLDKDPKERPTGINLPPVVLSFVRNPATETSLQMLQRAGKLVKNAKGAIAAMGGAGVAMAPAAAPAEEPAAAKGRR